MKDIPIAWEFYDDFKKKKLNYESLVECSKNV